MNFPKGFDTLLCSHVNELEKIISSQGYKTTLDKWEVQNQKALDKYQLVFSWLNKQDWYKNNQHKVTKYVNTIL